MMKYLSRDISLSYEQSKCVGCGRCIEVCPHAVFALVDSTATIANRESCMECGACEKNCEYGAISVSAGVGCAEAIIRGILTGKEPQCGCTPSDSTSSCC